MGTFTALDPFEGIHERPMSLNGYGYVHGNPINLTDASGEFPLALAAIPLAAKAMSLIASGLGFLISATALKAIASAVLGIAIGKIITVMIQGDRLMCVTCQGVQYVDLQGNSSTVLDPTAPDVVDPA